MLDRICVGLLWFTHAIDWDITRFLVVYELVSLALKVMQFVYFITNKINLILIQLTVKYVQL